jgi:hypothetical protein
MIPLLEYIIDKKTKILNNFKYNDYLSIEKLLRNQNIKTDIRQYDNGILYILVGKSNRNPEYNSPISIAFNISKKKLTDEFENNHEVWVQIVDHLDKDPKVENFYKDLNINFSDKLTEKQAKKSGLYKFAINNNGDFIDFLELYKKNLMK